MQVSCCSTSELIVLCSQETARRGWRCRLPFHKVSWKGWHTLLVLSEAAAAFKVVWRTGGCSYTPDKGWSYRGFRSRVFANEPRCRAWYHCIVLSMHFSFHFIGTFYNLDSLTLYCYRPGLTAKSRFTTLVFLELRFLNNYTIGSIPSGQSEIIASKVINYIKRCGRENLRFQ